MPDRAIAGRGMGETELARRERSFQADLHCCAHHRSADRIHLRSAATRLARLPWSEFDPLGADHEDSLLSRGEALLVGVITSEANHHVGAGCEDCNHSGFLGRIAIHEVFIITEEMRGLIARNASILDVQDCAHRHGFRTMHYDGVKKVLRGLTTIDEIELAVTHAA